MSRSPYLIVGLIIGVVGIGFYFEWPAIAQGWPFLIFLLCPFMHLFVSHDHGGGGHNSGGRKHEEPNHSSETKGAAEQPLDNAL